MRFCRDATLRSRATNGGVRNDMDFHEISFYGVPPSNGPTDGYSYASLKTIQALKAIGISVPWRHDKSPTSISFCQPEWYSSAPEQFKIGYTPWESTAIPKHWVPMMNAMDMIWTTSEFCKDVFISNGVEQDIIVVPHGIDEHDFSLSKRTVNDGFYFLHIGEPAVRKGGQMVVDAFLEVFGDDEDTHLIVKANGYATCRIRDPFGPVDKHPRITLITDLVNISELNALYNRCHALVYPSNGEGFGLIPFQGAATGMPVITAIWGGIKEFGEFCIPIDYKVGPSAHDYHLGEWAHPDFDSLCRTMYEVRLNFERFAENAFLGALTLRRAFRWDKLISKGLHETFLRSSV